MVVWIKVTVDALMLEITASLQQVLCRKVVLGIIIGAWGVGISIYRILEAVLKGADLCAS